MSDQFFVVKGRGNTKYSVPQTRVYSMCSGYAVQSVSFSWYTSTPIFVVAAAVMLLLLFTSEFPSLSFTHLDIWTHVIACNPFLHNTTQLCWLHITDANQFMAASCLGNKEIMYRSMARFFAWNIMYVT